MVPPVKILAVDAVLVDTSVLVAARLFQWYQSLSSVKFGRYEKAAPKDQVVTTDCLRLRIGQFWRTSTLSLLSIVSRQI